MKKCSNRKLTMVKIIMKNCLCFLFFLFIYMEPNIKVWGGGKSRHATGKSGQKKYDLGYRRRWGGECEKR